MSDKIRNYKFSVQFNEHGKGTLDKIEDFVFPAYDLNEALTQFGVKFQDHYTAKVLEVIPFQIVDENQPEKPEAKKEIHVKPNPIRDSMIKSPDTD